MSLGQGGVEWGGAEVLMGEREKGNKKSGFALYILFYWSRLIDGRALYRASHDKRLLYGFDGGTLACGFGVVTWPRDWSTSRRE